MLDAIVSSGIAISSLVVGWLLNEISSVRTFKRQVREVRLAVYQAAFARVFKLRDGIDDEQTYEDLRPLVEDLQTWWYSNSLSLDPTTNEALVGLANKIITNMLPSPRARNILTIDDVAQAFDDAEAAIRKNTGNEIKGVD